MGNYTKNLYKRGRDRKSRDHKEIIVSCAIRRGGVDFAPGSKSHAEVRSILGDTNIYESTPGDVEGFLSSTGRFLTRDEAKDVAVASGQCYPMQRELLSSDILRWS